MVRVTRGADDTKVRLSGVGKTWHKPVPRVWYSYLCRESPAAV